MLSPAYKPGVTDQFYPRRIDLPRFDLRLSLLTKSALLADEGVPYIQMDAPSYTRFVDELSRCANAVESGLDPDAALDEALPPANDLSGWEQT